MPKSRLIIIGVIGLVVILGLLIFFGILPGLRKGGSGNATTELIVWGVEPAAAMNEAAALLGRSYRITYRQFSPLTYEGELVDALAAGRGPDLFMVHASWIPKHFDKLTPIFAEQLSLRDFRTLYPTVIEQDFAPDGVIYALPLTIDTLALFYNRDLLDSAGIVAPPTDWTAFQDAVTRLRRLDAANRVVRAGAAIGGTSRNIAHLTDILSVLMLQTGASMVKADFSGAEFATRGVDSLQFYTKFANAAGPFYTCAGNNRPVTDVLFPALCTRKTRSSGT